MIKKILDFLNNLKLADMPTRVLNAVQAPGKEELLIKDLGIVKGLGFDPWIIYTQAYLESGIFKYVIGRANYWGIKKRKSWTGRFVAKETHEYVDITSDLFKQHPEWKTLPVINIKGKDYVYATIMDDFMDFENVPEALMWYCESLIKPVYPQSYAVRKDYQSYYSGLISGTLKYSTSPIYPDKLIVLYNQVKKDQRIIGLFNKYNI